MSNCLRNEINRYFDKQNFSDGMVFDFFKLLIEFNETIWYLDCFDDNEVNDIYNSLNILISSKLSLREKNELLKLVVQYGMSPYYLCYFFEKEQVDEKLLLAYKSLVSSINCLVVGNDESLKTKSGKIEESFKKIKEICGNNLITNACYHSIIEKYDSDAKETAEILLNRYSEYYYRRYIKILRAMLGFIAQNTIRKKSVIYIKNWLEKEDAQRDRLESYPTVGRVHRARSVENVIAEIKYYIKKFGIKVFNIEDDNFAFDFNRANDILDCLIKLDEDLTLNLPNGMTAINIDENMIKKYGKLKMKDSFIGLETTSEERLKKISKTFTSLDKVQHITELFNKYGMDIGASLVVGFPEQTIDQMIDDIVKLMQHNIKFGTANPCYPIPKSRLYEECLEQGFVDEKMDYTWYDEFNFPLETDLFTRKDIYELWNCSLVYAIYPAMLEVMKNGFNSMNNLLEAFSRFGYGEMYKSEFDSEVYYCVPLYKNTFSCMMKLSEQNDNENVFVDDWTCDILSNLCTLYTGINYEVYQAESALVPNGRNAFIIKQSGKISNIKTKLIGAIHKCEDK